MGTLNKTTVFTVLGFDGWLNRKWFRIQVYLSEETLKKVATMAIKILLFSWCCAGANTFSFENI